MFYHLELKHELTLHPRHFNSDVFENIERMIYAEVEGQCMGNYGFVVMVTGVNKISGGMLQPVSGLAAFQVAYQAIVMRPFKGEIMDAVVKQVNKVGLFAEAGPLNIFISKYSIPANMEFSDLDCCYSSNTDNYAIQVDTNVRVKIIGLRNDVSQLFAIGTLLEDYLGIIGSS